ncbi:MAG: F-type H+-transporting ATPase subunit epsilon [Paraglaciecola sp.]|jgi:F-type H+-transporting ATPase subunit epsilon
MQLKILLPYAVFAQHNDVARIVAETAEGSFGILPQRLDCMAALTPGILTFETPATGEVFIAVDEGILVKTGAQVLVSVRRAFGGVALSELREAVKAQFLTLNDQETEMRTVLAKLETGFLRRFSDLSLNK